jgi:hypothetical protein
MAMQDTWIQAPYTDPDFLSYVQPNVQTHPGNGVATGIATRYSVARTRRGYCVDTPSSCVASYTCGFRSAYASQDENVGPYQFTTDTSAPSC